MNADQNNSTFNQTSIVSGRLTWLFSFAFLICVYPCSSAANLLFAADVESRQLTHYLPQDFLETAVRTENWTEVPLAVKGGVRKGDVVRVWAGGSIDRGNGDQPGENVNGPDGLDSAQLGTDKPAFALSPEPAHAYALLFKTESTKPTKCLPAGKPLGIKLTKDQEKV